MTWRISVKRSGTKSLLRCVQTWWPTTRNVWPLWLPTRVLPQSTLVLMFCRGVKSSFQSLKCKSIYNNLGWKDWCCWCFCFFLLAERWHLTAPRSLSVYSSVARYTGTGILPRFWLFRNGTILAWRKKSFYTPKQAVEPQWYMWPMFQIIQFPLSPFGASAWNN